MFSTVTEEAFFERPDTLATLRSLSDSKNLVIYCGAGATIDQASLNWNDLANSLLTSADPNAAMSDDARKAFSAQRLATIAVQRYKRVHGVSTPERIANRLRVMLYDQAPWAAGDLMPSLSFLALIRDIKGLSPLTLVTTNYDVYLEDVFERRRVNIYIQRELLQPPSTNPLVNIYYLHGRVPRTGRHRGNLVISEGDYSRTARQSQRTLRQLFRDSEPLPVAV